MTRLLPWVGAVLLIATGVCILGFFASAGRQNRRSDTDSERAARLPNALPHGGYISGPTTVNGLDSISPEFARAAVRPPRPRVEFHDHLDVDAFIASLNPGGELPCRLHDPDQCRFTPCCPTCPTEKD